MLHIKYPKEWVVLVKCKIEFVKQKRNSTQEGAYLVLSTKCYSLSSLLKYQNLKNLEKLSYRRQEKKVADLGTFGGFVLDFTLFIYQQIIPFLTEISWSSGLRHQVSNQDILQFCGSIPSPAIFFFIKLIFHSVFFYLLILKNIFSSFS